MCHLILGIPVISLALFAFMPFGVALPLYLVLTAFSAFVWWKVAQAMHVPVKGGTEGMSGQLAQVQSWNGREGRIIFHGELWTARSRDPEPPRPGARVRITGVEGLKAWVSQQTEDQADER